MNQQNFAQKPFWQKHKFLVISLSVLAIVSIVAVSLTFLNWNDREPSTQIVAYESRPKTKPIESEDIETLAEARLKQITNGVDLIEIETQAVRKTNQDESSISSPTPTPDPVPGSVAGGPTGNASGLPNDPIGLTPSSSRTDSINPIVIDQEAAEEIINENEINDQIAFYTKSEISLPNESQFDIFPHYYESGHSNVDFNQPREIETWFSANYYKSITRQNGELKSLYLSTPDYYLIYMGGQYAIQENYQEKQYLSGLYEDEYINPELSFLRYILSDDSNLQDLGKETVDSKELRVYAYTSKPYQTGEKVNSELVTYTTKYYIDEDNFVLYMVEELENNNIIYREKTLASEELTGETIIEEVYTKSEIQEAKIKEIDWKVYEYVNPPIF